MAEASAPCEERAADGGRSRSRSPPQRGEKPAPALVPVAAAALFTLLETPETFRVERVHFSELSVAAFRRDRIARVNPLIITGLAPYLAPGGLGLDLLREVLSPFASVPVLEPCSKETLYETREFFERLRKGESLYLCDVSIDRHVPVLAQHVRAPRYFLHCFSRRTRLPNPAADHTPSLFVGAAGTGSSLHIDQFCSHFWMFLAEGQKKWTAFHRDDAGFLTPTFDRSAFMPRFLDLKTLEADIRTRDEMLQARRVDFVLQAGEVLFVPQGTPHEVQNLTETVAVSANFFDQSNLEAAKRRMAAKLERCGADVIAGGPAARSELEGMLQALSEAPWPELEDDLDSGEEAPLPGEAMVGPWRLAAVGLLSDGRGPS